MHTSNVTFLPLTRKLGGVAVGICKTDPNPGRDNCGNLRDFDPNPWGGVVVDVCETLTQTPGEGWWWIFCLVQATFVLGT